LAGVWALGGELPSRADSAQGSDTGDLTRRFGNLNLTAGAATHLPRAPNVPIQLDSMLDLIDVGVECSGVEPASTDR
jgi:hypothetical protein